MYVENVENLMMRSGSKVDSVITASEFNGTFGKCAEIRYGLTTTLLDNVRMSWEISGNITKC